MGGRVLLNRVEVGGGGRVLLNRVEVGGEGWEAGYCTGWK